MRPLREARSSTIWHKLGLALLAVVSCSAVGLCLYHLYSPGQKELRETRRKIDETKANIERLQQENGELDERRKKLAAPGNPLYIEKVARGNIGLVKNGETVYHIQEQE